MKKQEQLIHYLYRLNFKQDPRYYYYGIHSTDRVPEKDGYYGSGGTVSKYKKLFGKDCFQKTILSTYFSREELLKEEAKLVGDLWKSDPFCLNQTKGGAENGKFDNKGTVIVNNGIQEKFIYPEYLDIFLVQGWEKGRMSSVKSRMKGRYVGYVTLHKGDIVHRVPKEQVEELLKDGWNIGEPDFVLEKKRERSRGYLIVNNGTEERHIRPKELTDYLENGWLHGRLSRVVEAVRKYGKGRILINNGTEERKITQSEWEHYQIEGWKKGYLEGTTKKFGHKGNTHTRGKIGVCKNGKDRKINPEELETYEQMGWKRGRTPYKKSPLVAKK